MRYRAIGFDYGGVIAGHGYTTFSDDVAALIGITSEQFQAVYFQHNHRLNVDGESTAEAYAKILTQLGVPEKLDAVIAFINGLPSPEVNRDMLGLVDRLRANGYAVGLLSNFNREGGQRMRDEGLDTHFDAFCISADIGYQKPSAEAYAALTNALKVKPSELIFIDDAERSLQSATEIGYYPIRITDYQSLLQELHRLGVKTDT